MIFNHLYKCLSQDTALASLCAGRFYPNLAQQGINSPHIVYQQISAPVDYMSSGESRDRHIVQFDLRCFGPQGHASPGYSQAHAVARAARGALERVTDQTHPDGGVLLSAHVTNTLDMYDEQAKWHFVVLSVQLYYCEES